MAFENPGDYVNKTSWDHFSPEEREILLSFYYLKYISSGIRAYFGPDTDDNLRDRYVSNSMLHNYSPLDSKKSSGMIMGKISSLTKAQADLAQNILSEKLEGLLPGDVSCSSLFL